MPHQDDEQTSQEAVRNNLCDVDAKKQAKDEYDRSMDYCKHCTLIQFGQISVFLAAMTACVVFFYGEHPPSGTLLKFGKLGTSFIAFCLWITTESHAYMSGHFFRRVAQLEIILGYQGLSRMPGMPDYRYGPAKWALRGIYFVFSIFWLVAFTLEMME
ncbi:MAG: hypothetical protein V1800_08145 [Candidatus Latescibacterota bacterium]